MSGRDLVILGTGSRAPTRARNVNGYLLRWEHEAILIDPGEGTQRQLSCLGLSAHNVTHICLTHLHGDHSLGLPGVLEELGANHEVPEIPIHFPAHGLPYVERLCHVSPGVRPPVRLDPVGPTGAAADVVVHPGPPLRISARSLLHPVDAVGWRFEEPSRRHLRPDRLAAAGVHGPMIGRLERDGAVEVDGHRVTLHDVSEVQPGFRAAVLLDTSRCEAAIGLARDVDLLLCEATFLEAEADLAAAHGHLTAAQAGAIAAEAGAGLLVLTHFSDRYDDLDGHQREAATVFPNVVCAHDLQVIPALRYRSAGAPFAPTSRPGAEAPERTGAVP